MKARSILMTTLHVFNQLNIMIIHSLCYPSPIHPMAGSDRSKKAERLLLGHTNEAQHLRGPKYLRLG